MIRICKKINGNVKFACHCGERSDETIHGIEAAMDCRVPLSLAMTIFSYLQFTKFSFETGSGFRLSLFIFHFSLFT